MSKFEIEVEGLPEGWEPVAFRVPKNDESFIRYDGNVAALTDTECEQPRLIVEKKRPRRIVLEETEEKVNGICHQHWVRTDGSVADLRIISENKWREVKETEETKLCLSVEECEQLAMDCRIGEVGDVYKKLIKFIQNNKTS